MAPTCPSCGKTIVRRRNGKTGQSFWGCAGFPDCRWSMDAHKHGGVPNPEPWSITLTGLAHYDCPRCAGPMVMRVNGDTGKGFYGCTHFPHCRGTRELDGLPSGHPDPHGNMDDYIEESNLDNGGWGAE